MHPELHDHEPDEVPHTHPDPGVDPHQPLVTGARALRIGIGGPVGSGKTALVAALCRTLGAELRLAVVTNDIYTTEDADFLLRNGVLPADRIRAVETGCCPHTAIRDDISANLDAVEDLETSLGPLDLVLVESGGDNLTATFSKGLIDRQIFVIDVAGGDKVPRKGGPGVTAADLLVINKIDLAPLVGADLSVMDRDAAARRGALPTVFLSLVQDRAATPVADWIRALITARNPVAGNPAADAPAADVLPGSLPTSNTQATSYPASNAQAPSYPADSAQATSYPASNAQGTSLPASGAQATSLPASGAQATSLPASGAQATSLPASGAQATSLPASGAQATGLPAADISAAG